MIMKNLNVRKGEEQKLFFLDTKTVLREKNLRIFYVTLGNLLKIAKDSELKKAPDPLVHLIGFSVKVDRVGERDMQKSPDVVKKFKKSRSRKSCKGSNRSRKSSKKSSYREKLLGSRNRSIKVYQMRENSLTK